MGEKRRKCPFCSEEILPDAKKCRFCGEWLDRPTAETQEEKETPTEKKQSFLTKPMGKYSKKESIGCLSFIVISVILFLLAIGALNKGTPLPQGKIKVRHIPSGQIGTIEVKDYDPEDFEIIDAGSYDINTLNQSKTNPRQECVKAVIKDYVANKTEVDSYNSSGQINWVNNRYRICLANKGQQPEDLLTSTYQPPIQQPIINVQQQPQQDIRLNCTSYTIAGYTYTNCR